jgi:DNA-binding MarR family transcriptional regulator
MLRTTHRLRRDLGERLSRDHGLSMADYDALVTLAGQPSGSMRMAALADAILQPRSSVTRIIASLEDRDLVHRSPTPGDARGASAGLTRKGRRVFAQAHRTHLAGIREHFLRHLSPTQLRHLAEAWEAINP